MNRAVRILGVVVGTLVFVALGALYPAFARGEAWLGSLWTAPMLAWLPREARLPTLGIVAVVAAGVVVWRTTLAADTRTPRLRVSTVAPLATGPRGFRTRLRDLPGMLRGAALVLAILALGRPQNVLRGESSDERGIDIVLVLDLSGSMRALMDADSEPSRNHGQVQRLTRLETAKEVILDFVARRRADRIGVVVFGRAAYILSPPTLDKALLSTLVSKMELGLIDGNGTAIGDAVGTAVARLRRSTARSKAIILLTDGDSNAGSIAPDYAAHLAQTQGVRVYTVQIGNGDDVDVQEGTDLFGQPKFVREHFPVNPELLKRMASTTGGDAFVATDKKGLEQSMHQILDKLEKTRFEAQASTMEDLFPFLLVPAVALIALEALLRLLLVRRFP
ncbi:MAG: VWA domain-containing protein [Deltaproteobacteria bacterium]|nr:VWA domain-containing protein [Deltaproteobacteria bacterium]